MPVTNQVPVTPFQNTEGGADDEYQKHDRTLPFEEEVCDSIIPSLHLTLNFGGPGFLGERDSGGGVWGNFGGGGRLGERGGGGGSRLGLVSPLRTLLITVVEEEFADSSVPDLHLTLDLSSPDLMDAGDRGGGVRAREVDEVCKGEVF
ncbi:hypothetical protein LTR09_006399 [Extremus antarcticus]|uniref:Uncharacterized protein n=1 Tax=Extremus antarcticus TaxID=702011 RepID=A0AAJ0GBU2_9PEZI|nr:hypothetical protein LTR09_006399 [Extremus antarcticus]